MTTPPAPPAMTCPLCGAPADLLGAHAPPAARAVPPGPAGEAVPRCERVERALARRADERHAAAIEGWGADDGIIETS